MNTGLADRIHLDRSSTLSLAGQIERQIKEMIATSELPDGHKLPSTRKLSKELGINRATVAAAYGKLEKNGLARTGVGSGTYISYREPDQSDELDQTTQQPLFSAGAASLLRLQAELPDFSAFPDPHVNFAALVPDETLFPVGRFRECLNHTLDRKKALALQYAGSLGSPELREMIAGRMCRKGVPVTADRILIVSGAQQGCDLVFRTFLSPGSRIIVGSPTYHNIYPLMRQMEVGVAPVPVASAGMDTAALERAAGDSAARLIYTMPNFQNPTGVTASAENRRRVLSIAAKANLPLLEDDYEGDLAFDGAERPSIQSLDREERVLYVGTFSKSLFPGLRVGWIAAPPRFITVLAALKKASDLENSALLQGALVEFCARGYYDEHLEKMRALIRERMECALAALERFMPGGTAWPEPKGGYGFWVGLPEGIRSDRVFQRAGERGVLVSPGTLFTGGEDPGGVRLSISRTDRPAIEEGIRILADVIRAEASSPGPAAAARTETPQHL